MERPQLSWSGRAYWDCNWGETPLEQDFTHWHWSRTAGENGTAVMYDVRSRDRPPQRIALRYDPAGGAVEFPVPNPVQLPRTLWGLRREACVEAGEEVSVQRTLTDAPFYARSVLDLRRGEDRMHSIHETLSLERFRTKWTQAMLPFRMPRVSYPIRSW